MSVVVSPNPHRIGLGISLRVGAMLSLAIMQGLVKWVGEQGIPTFEMLFFRNFFGFVPLVIYIAATTGWSVLKTTRPMAHATRAGIGLVGMVCMFGAVQNLPLTEAAAFNFTTPIAMTALSALVLKEYVGPHRWAAVAVGFIGVLIMIKPAPGHFNAIGVLFAMGSVIGGAGASVTIRQIGATEKGATIVFYFTLAGTLLGAVGSLFGWKQPDLPTLALLISIGLTGGLAQILLTEALRAAPVGVVAPFDYTQLAWATAISIMVWNDLPGPLTLIGASIIAVSGGYILYRELKGGLAVSPPTAVDEDG
ncbi:DMT family transporter [Phenylobacterium immobile]|uniref:DMT family transporter n=1 Tax=Phenylobacterium immobile TaxID=21 RepID=UPI00159EE051|nr:DMT family transporter [Phenylobacterium immobile]